MKFSGKIEDGTSNKPFNFGSNPWPWRSFVLSQCTRQAKVYILRVLLVYHIFNLLLSSFLKFI